MDQQPEIDQTTGVMTWLSRARWALAVVAGILLICVGVRLLRERLPSTSVVEVSLEPSRWQRLLGGGAWRNLPLQISAKEEELVTRCVKLAQRYRSLRNRKRQFFEDEVRAELESILQEQPGHFYVEFLLGQWHRGAGSAELAARFWEQAFEHAPVTLRQRYQFADGRPLVGATVDSYEIECLRVRNGALDPSLRLLFPGLTTDDEGCIFLPVYETVCRRYSMSAPGGHITKYPRLGYFRAGCNGELPIARIWRPGEDPSGNPSYEDASASKDLRLAKDGWSVGVEWVARNRRDGSVAFTDGRAGPAPARELPPTSPLVKHASWLDAVCCQMDVEPGRLEVIRLKVFDHQSRLPLPDHQYRAGLIALGTDRLCLWSIDRPLPDKVDLWLETFVCTPGATVYRLEPQAGTSVRVGTGRVSVSEIHAGQMDYSGRFVPPARDIHQTLSVSLAVSRLPQGKRYIVVAVDKQGRRRPSDCFLNSMAGNFVEYVDIPLDSLSHFELKELGSREKVYFDGVHLPSADEEPLGPAPALEVAVDGKPVSWSADNRLPGQLRLAISPEVPKTGSPASGSATTGNAPSADKARSFTLFLGQCPGMLGQSPERSMILLDRNGKRLDWRPSRSSSSVSVNGWRAERLVFQHPLRELGTVRIALQGVQ